MQRKLKLSLVLLCAAVVLIAAYAFSTKPFFADLFVEYDSTKNPINIVFRYGVQGKNELDTFNGTFAKDLVIDGTATGRLYLSKQDLLQIQVKLTEIGFFEYPDTFPSQGIVTPRGDGYLKVANGSIVKEVSWYSDSDYEDSRVKSLHDTAVFLMDLIESKPAYKAFPPANGAYM